MEGTAIVGKTPITVDAAIALLGGFRQFQWLLDASFCFMAMPVSFQILLMYFAAIDPPWKCVSNSSLCLLNGSLPSSNSDRCGMPRTEWEYTLPREFSITTQFDLNCENQWIKHLTTSILFVGWGVGAIVLGWVADNYGRKIVIYVSQGLIIVIGFIFSLLGSVPILVICRFIIGFFIPGATVQPYILISEYVGPKHRPIAGLLIFICMSVSFCILTLKAYLIREWKILSIVCTVPYIICLVTYKFVPESVRWLRLKRGKNELMKTFRIIAAWNKKELPDDIVIMPPSPEVVCQKFSILDVFRTGKLAIRSIILGYSWLVNGMVYYGLVLAASDLGGSLYLNFFLLTAVGIPANVATIYLCRRFGRKKTVIISFFLASLFCITIAFITAKNEGKIIRVIFGMIGKFSINISFSGIYVWSLETYPTTIRSNGMGYLQVTSRMGAAAAPWVAKGLLTLHHTAPFVVMGGASLIGAFLLAIISETKGKPTLETNEDTQNTIEIVVSNDDDEKIKMVGDN